MSLTFHHLIKNSLSHPLTCKSISELNLSTGAEITNPDYVAQLSEKDQEKRYVNSSIKVWHALQKYLKVMVLKHHSAVVIPEFAAFSLIQREHSKEGASIGMAAPSLKRQGLSIAGSEHVVQILVLQSFL